MTEGDGPARNFRSSYYEKLGFCGNDATDYLDILTEASPFDIEKLHELCESAELSRKCVDAWKLLLGVECGRKNPFDDYANVRRVRSEHFHLLEHHLQVLLRHNLLINKNRLNGSRRNNNGHLEELPNDNNDGRNNHTQDQAARDDHARLIVLMYLLETGRLDTLDVDGQLKSEESCRLLAMAAFFVNVAGDLQEAFFLFRNLTNHMQNKPKS